VVGKPDLVFNDVNTTATDELLLEVCDNLKQPRSTVFTIATKVSAINLSKECPRRCANCTRW
jgi:hypothetical protein